MKHKIIKKEIAGDVYYGYYDENGNFIYHNVNGPAVAIIQGDGTTFWYVHGLKHRNNGPAVICADGHRQWWRDGKLHREDGPAVIYEDESKEWWTNNNHISEEVEKWLEERNLDPDNLNEEDQLALSFYMRSL